MSTSKYCCRRGAEKTPFESRLCVTARASSTPERNPEPDAFRVLYCAEDAGEIGGRGITLRSQHAHEALDGNLGALFQVQKSDSRVDVVAKNGFAGCKVSVDDALDGLAQKRTLEL